MLTSDLYTATDTLLRLLRFNMERLRGTVPALNVTSIPPEDVDGNNTVNLYLYHALEDAQMRNRIDGEAGRATATAPLVLNLYYILTAHHGGDGAFDAAEQQFLLGLAMKTLHDFPRITDAVAFDRGGALPEPVVPATHLGRGARLDIAMRPVSAEDAINFWSAESMATVRLAGYYEVRSVFLEPEEVSRIAAPVIDLGLYVAPASAIAIDRTASLYRFTPPAATGLGAQSIEARPARPLLSANPSPGEADVTLTGTGFGTAATGRIVLRRADWLQRDPTLASVEIDPALNPGWAVTIASGTAGFRWAGSLDHAPGGVVETLDILPGHYLVSVRRSERRPGPGGTFRTTVVESNLVGMALGPRIAGHSALAGDGTIEIDIEPLFDMLAPEVAFGLAVEGRVYDEVAALSGDPLADRGRFARTATGLRLHPDFDATVPGAHPLRLTVNGVESQPFWIVT
jgi:hypothetical protein